MIFHHYFLLFVLGFIISATKTQAFAPSNYFRPYDQAWQLPAIEQHPFNITIATELGSDEHNAHTVNSDRCNVLAIYNPTQSLLAALRSPVNEAAQTTYRNLWQSFYNPRDDGKMGNALFNGTFQQSNIFINGTYSHKFSGLPGTFSLNLYIPIIKKKIKDFSITDLTPDASSYFRPRQTLQAPLVQAYMADLIAHAQTLGGLSLGAWEKTGLGDIAILTNWHANYEQEKENLKNVHLFGQIGVSIPTGDPKDEDTAFSMPMGYDGAWGIPLGIGMHLDFVNKIQAGIEVDFVGLFNKTRDRRMKTDITQTEFLLFNKGRATKEYGLQWQFHLFLAAIKIIEGLSVKCGYQFMRKDADHLIPTHNDFTYSIVNSANTLKEWTSNNLIFSLDYNFTNEFLGTALTPQISLFYKYSLAAKGIIDNNTLGAKLAVNF